MCVMCQVLRTPELERAVFATLHAYVNFYCKRFGAAQTPFRIFNGTPLPVRGDPRVVLNVFCWVDAWGRRVERLLRIASWKYGLFHSSDAGMRYVQRRMLNGAMDIIIRRNLCSLQLMPKRCIRSDAPPMYIRWAKFETRAKFAGGHQMYI